MRREAYYPSSSALNYLNANDVRGRGREGVMMAVMMMMAVVGRCGEGGDEGEVRVWQEERTRRERRQRQRGANLLLLGVSGSGLVILESFIS